jgi:hypothetical protein
MSIKKPYYRMFRLNKQGGSSDYVVDHRNVLDWSSPIRAFDLIVKDFKKICEYIEPNDDCPAVYSHRIYELFIRTCTEIESNMKNILRTNGYTKEGNWNINDYKRLEPAMKLSDYKVLINFWNNGRGTSIVPFKNWASGRILTWYDNYGQVKHSREDKFHLASLDNLVESICGLFIILFSQFGGQVFSPYQIIYEYDILDGVISDRFSIFSILPPVWDKSEKYDFNWSVLKEEEYPFEKFETF